MGDRSFVRRAALLISLFAIVIWAAAPVQAQTRGAATPYIAPQTPWGDPDLQSVWNFSTPTPLERPAEYADREFLSEAEVEEAADRAASRDRRAADPVADVRQAYNEFWSERGRPTGRTSLVVDPPNGRLPSLTPEGERRAAALRSDGGGERGADTWEDRNLWERCLTRGGLPRIPGSYNNNVQIFQTPHHVAILYEMIHETRIIPIDRRPHLGDGIRQWLGDSRGRWEGQTLVVETTNFTDRTSFRGTTAEMKLVERFTRTAEDTIDYRFTVEDPATFTSSWTALLPMTRLDERIYEYACHEGNYGMLNLLTGARVQEKAARSAGPTR
jgi:hypothetical protein